MLYDNEPETQAIPRITLDANTALVLFQAMRDTEDGALELTMYDANGDAVVFVLADDCHAHLPAEEGQAEIDFGTE